MGLTYGDYLAIKQLLEGMEQRMGVREDAAYEKLNSTIVSVKEGWAALVAENANLREQLANAGVEFQAQLDADSEVDAGKVETADASLAELVAVAEPTP